MMTFRHTISLSLAAALFGAGFAATAEAATPRVRHSHNMHMVAAHGHMHGRTAPAVGADHSADSLNAQSLSRAQGATQ